MRRTFLFTLTQKDPSEFPVEQRVKSNEQRVKSDEQQSKSNEQQAKNNEQRRKSKDQRAKATSNEEKVTSNKQKVTSNEQRAKSFTSLFFYRRNNKPKTGIRERKKLLIMIKSKLSLVL